MRIAFLLCAFLITLPAPASKAGFEQIYPMDVVQAEYGFMTVSSPVTVVVSSLNISPLTIMSLAYIQDDQEVYMPLEVYETEVDGCGSVHYFAKVSDQIGEPRPLGFRYSVHLTDHTSRRCRDMKPYLWEAEVRSGYGWCGTGDSTMSLRGNPTIISH